MIYGRFGDPITIVRVATLEDVRKLEGRKPDKADLEAVRNGSYVVVRRTDDSAERLYHQAFMRADDGSREITAAIEALTSGEQDPLEGAAIDAELAAEREARAIGR